MINNLEDKEKESIRTKTKQHSTVRTVRTVHPFLEKRLPTEIRMRRSIHESVMSYCGFARITAGQFYEEAAILFIDLNPVDGVLLTMEKKKRENDFEGRMTELVCIDELEDFVERVDGIKRSGVEIHRSNIKKLLKILKECNKIKNRSERLDVLMDKAMSYFE